ncbi:MAG: PAS domain S-box protein [Chloroflexi bacterium]|nr:PAS domain S-box protein [Chloroflexota bacterium]
MPTDLSYKKFFQLSSEFFCTISRDGYFIATNPALLRALRYSHSDLSDLTFTAIIHPDDRQYVLKYLDELIKGQEQGPIPIRLIRQDGSYLSVEWQCSYAPDEDIVYGAGRERQSLQAVERQLQESESRYRTLLEGASVAMLVIDDEGVIKLVNRRTILLFGYDKEELIAKHFHVLLPGHFRELHGKLEARYWLNPTSRPMGYGAHFTALRKDGSEFPADIALSHLQIDNAPHVVAFISDLTDRLEADRLQQELEKEKELRQLKSRFLSMVAHDFRTPLTLIMSTAGMLRMMEGKIETNQRIEQLNKIDHQVNTLSQLLDEISFINKNEMAGYRLDLMPIDVCIFLQQKSEELQNAFQKPMTFQISCPDTAPLLLLDELLINKIFSNLISNAIKYCDEHTGEVNIGFEILEDWVKVSVHDNGIGIPEKDQRYVFEAFHRGENVGSIKGSGLGLMIVKQSIEAHGGRIEFNSVPGEGSTFTVYLPAKPIH